MSEQRDRAEQAVSIFEEAFRRASSLSRMPEDTTDTPKATGPRKPAPVPEAGHAGNGERERQVQAEEDFEALLQNSFRRAGGI